MREFIGRERELETLKLLLKKRAASFVVIRGRRRIGKSRLIQEFGRSAKCRLFTGTPPTRGITRQSQLDAFCSQMSRLFAYPKFTVEDWGEVFWHLGRACESGRIILALDEISWIGSKDPDFLGQLKTAWDLFFSKNSQLILIVCGSISSWIERNILSSTGFVGRISLDMHLKELSLPEAIRFWEPRLEQTSSYEILKVLSVTGGVPRYLEEVIPELSAEENMGRLCFNPQGLLYREFDSIFSDLFSKKTPTYSKIMQAIADGSQDATQIQGLTRLQRRMTVTNALQDLVQAGFVAEDPTWNLASMRASNLKRYRLSDNYMRFYLKCLRPFKDRVDEDWTVTSYENHLPGWHPMIGLQFENLVIRNAHLLFEILRIHPADVVCAGPFFQRTTKRHKGCQADLLIQTRTQSLYLCEIKYSKEPIGMSAGHQATRLAMNLSRPRGYSTRLVLVHVNGVSSALAHSRLFDHIVDFGELLRR